MTTLEDKSIWETTPEEEVLGADILKANTEEIINRTRLLDNDIKVRKQKLFDSSCAGSGARTLLQHSRTRQ